MYRNGIVSTIAVLKSADSLKKGSGSVETTRNHHALRGPNRIAKVMACPSLPMSLPLAALGLVNIFLAAIGAWIL